MTSDQIAENVKLIDILLKHKANELTTLEAVASIKQRIKGISYDPKPLAEIFQVIAERHKEFESFCNGITPQFSMTPSPSFRCEFCGGTTLYSDGSGRCNDCRRLPETPIEKELGTITI